MVGDEDCDRNLAGAEHGRKVSNVHEPIHPAHHCVACHLAVFDDRPMPEEPRKLLTFRIFAARPAAELVRLRLERQLRESEERLRDLSEEAPIAYVRTLRKSSGGAGRCWARWRK